MWGIRLGKKRGRNIPSKNNMAKFTSTFIEIKNFGVFEKDDHDSWKAGNFKVRNGYLGVRSIDTDDGRHLRIFCEIFKTEFGYPKYKCTVYDKDNVSDGKEIKTVESFQFLVWLNR